MAIMNYDRIYEYRFKDVDPQKKKIAWAEIADFIYKKLSKPKSILDPAAGNCEFINSVKCKTKWTVDLNDHFIKMVDPGIKTIIGDILKTDLPQDFFDAVFISNFLEHLTSQEQVAEL